MSYEKTVSAHYSHGSLLKSIEAALPALGRNINTITIEDLAPVDEFHIGGRTATDHLLSQLNFPEKSNILDVGCGLGGATRYVATTTMNSVTGIDLTAEYIKTGQVLNERLKLDEKITLLQGSALAMPFSENMFDGGYMLHVGMNIEDKTALFSEIYRVLRPGSSFGVYDIMQKKIGDLIYPVPWAAKKDTSMLASSSQYKQALKSAGFEITKETSREDFALDFFRQQREKTKSKGNPPPLGLHTLMQQSTAVKIQNMIKNIIAGLIAPVEIIVKKI